MIPLKAFDKRAIPPVWAGFDLDGRKLRIRFAFDFDDYALENGPVPGRYTQFERRDGLWQTTCFEAFWRLPDHPNYFELNLSGIGPYWNLYAFDRYREPQPPRVSEAYTLVSLSTKLTGIEAELEAKADDEALEASLAVILRANGQTRYLATEHAGERPDFHHPDSFIIHPRRRG